MDALLKSDLYELLQISRDAEEKEIKSAYRKKALTCHPDKNPDNPRAAELFQELSRALEILTDKEAKAAYDKVLRAREASQARNRELDAKRRKLKEDLEAREQQALNRKVEEVDAAKQLEKQIERLRKEGSKKLEEERELLRQQLAKERDQNLEPSKWLPRLKVKWKVSKGEDEDYDETTLKKLFSKYGEVTCVVVSTKKKGSALVEFETATAAKLALEMERGNTDRPLTVTWAQEPPGKRQIPATTAAASLPTRRDDLDYESAVLARLRQAQERRDLSQKIASEET